jgi:hypothetical protein
MIVYDNDAKASSPYKTVISIHTATYWLGSNPASITIYRLDPEGTISDLRLAFR